MKKIIMALVLLGLSSAYTFSQEKYTLLYQSGIDVGFFPEHKGLNQYLWRGISAGEITPYVNTDQFADFSQAMKPSELDQLKSYYDESFSDSIEIKIKEWDVEIQSKKNQVQALALTFSTKYEPFKPDRKIVLKYSECKAYLDKLYQNSLKHQKIDYLEGAWFDLDNHNRQLAFSEALEKGLYQGLKRKAGQEYPGVNSFEFIEEQRALRLKALRQKNKSPFFMQNADNEKHTVLTRLIDFNIFNYPYHYPFYDSLSLRAQLDIIRKEQEKKPGQSASGIPDSYWGSPIIDSTQNYRMNREWLEAHDNFFQKIYQGIVTGKISVYQPKEGREKFIPQSIEEFVQTLYYQPSQGEDSVMVNPSDLLLKIREYYYLDLEGNPTRSLIDYLSLVIPQGYSPNTEIGSLKIASLKFSEVKNYLDKLFQDSKGKLASVQGMEMSKALAQHQHYTGLIQKFFNPFDYDIASYIYYENYSLSESAYLQNMHAVQDQLKDKRNLVRDMPSRAKDAMPVLPPNLHIYDAETNAELNPENFIRMGTKINFVYQSNPFSKDHDPAKQYEIQTFELSLVREGRVLIKKVVNSSSLDLSTLDLMRGDTVVIKMRTVQNLDMKNPHFSPYFSFKVN